MLNLQLALFISGSGTEQQGALLEAVYQHIPVRITTEIILLQE